MSTKISFISPVGTATIYDVFVPGNHFKYKIIELIKMYMPQCAVPFFRGAKVIVDGIPLGRDEMPVFPINNIEIYYYEYEMRYTPEGTEHRTIIGNTASKWIKS